ncbi:MAG TPA: ATP-binding protein [Candidatus Eisenbacteria bacterium]|jgi:two-component system phosphate regulon sensor histidine kinase PhoR
MGQSLRTRLFLASAIVVLVALGAATWLLAREQRRWLLDRHAESLARAAGALVRELAAGSAEESADWSATAHAWGQTLGLRVTLMAADGRVLGDSDVSAERLGRVENHAARPEMREALAGRTGRATRRSRTVGIEFLYVARPARAGEVAVVRVAEPLTAIASLRDSLLRVSIAATALALLLSLGLAYWIAGRHTGRIRELEAAAASLGRGEPAARARELPADELGRLGRAFNRMAAELRARLAALERERDMRERVVAHLGDGVALVDGQGRLVHANRALADLLGDGPPPAPGTPLEDFARAPELTDLVRRARAGTGVLEAELRLWTPAPRVLHATAEGLGAGSGDAVLLVLHDQTATEAANRVRQEFVANVSHELRTPLTSLRGYAETLLAGGLEDAESREGFVRTIHDQAVRLEALIGDLLSLAELERPGAPLRVGRLDLREVAAAQAAVFLPRAQAGGLTLEVERGESVPVDADRARLEQVFANLLDNAVKYTERGGITVALGVAGGKAWCEVRDTGPGIPGEDQPRIFERFYRVDKARSREKGGTGLGLSIVKHIVLLHGGEVAVRSRLGEGSVFRFEIPRALRRRSSDPSPAAPPVRAAPAA